MIAEPNYTGQYPIKKKIPRDWASNALDEHEKGLIGSYLRGQYKYNPSPEKQHEGFSGSFIVGGHGNLDHLSGHHSEHMHKVHDSAWSKLKNGEPESEEAKWKKENKPDKLITDYYELIHHL